jgi:hypothetical protein
MQYNYYTDGTTFYRDGVRASNYVVDVAITALGFAGALNTDWVNILTVSV